MAASSSSYTIYSYPNNPRAWKSQIAGKYNGIDISITPVEMGKTNKTKDFKKLNPNCKVPTLVGPDGAIWESNAMARYVARLNDSAKLYGRSTFESGQVDQWIDWCSNEIDLPAGVWLYPIFGYIQFDAEATQAAKGDIKKALGILNGHLATRTFLVGDRFSLADIVVAMSLVWLYKTVLEPGFRRSCAHTNRWFETVVNQPNVKAVIGEVKFCEKMQKAQATAAPKKAAAQDKGKQPAKKAAQSKPQQEKPKVNPQLRNPFGHLPATKFDLYGWKTSYTNDDFRTKSLPAFWNGFEPENWSIWLSEYKYNDEEAALFQRSNLVGGFCQRTPAKLNKGAFGSVLILGDGPAYKIWGGWLFRGQEIPLLFKENPDFDCYTWTKVDVSDRQNPDLKFVEDLWGWDGELRGLKNNDAGAIFK